MYRNKNFISRLIKEASLSSSKVGVSLGFFCLLMTFSTLNKQSSYKPVNVLASDLPETTITRTVVTTSKTKEDKKKEDKKKKEKKKIERNITTENESNLQSTQIIELTNDNKKNSSSSSDDSDSSNEEKKTTIKQRQINVENQPTENKKYLRINTSTNPLTFSKGGSIELTNPRNFKEDDKEIQSIPKRDLKKEGKGHKKFGKKGPSSKKNMGPHLMDLNYDENMTIIGDTSSQPKDSIPFVATMQQIRSYMPQEAKFLKNYIEKYQDNLSPEELSSSDWMYYNAYIDQKSASFANLNSLIDSPNALKRFNVSCVLDNNVSDIAGQIILPSDNYKFGSRKILHESGYFASKNEADAAYDKTKDLDYKSITCFDLAGEQRKIPFNIYKILEEAYKRFIAKKETSNWLPFMRDNDYNKYMWISYMLTLILTRKDFSNVFVFKGSPTDANYEPTIEFSSDDLDALVSEVFFEDSKVKRKNKIKPFLLNLADYKNTPNLQNNKSFLVLSSLVNDMLHRLSDFNLWSHIYYLSVFKNMSRLLFKKSDTFNVTTEEAFGSNKDKIVEWISENGPDSKLAFSDLSDIANESYDKMVTDDPTFSVARYLAKESQNVNATKLFGNARLKHKDNNKSIDEVLSFLSKEFIRLSMYFDLYGTSDSDNFKSKFATYKSSFKFDPFDYPYNLFSPVTVPGKMESFMNMTKNVLSRVGLKSALPKIEVDPLKTINNKVSTMLGGIIVRALRHCILRLNLSVLSGARSTSFDSAVDYVSKQSWKESSLNNSYPPLFVSNMGTIIPDVNHSNKPTKDDMKNFLGLNDYFQNKDTVEKLVKESKKASSTPAEILGFFANANPANWILNINMNRIPYQLFLYFLFDYITSVSNFVQEYERENKIPQKDNAPARGILGGLTQEGVKKYDQLYAFLTEDVNYGSSVSSLMGLLAEIARLGYPGVYTIAHLKDFATVTPGKVRGLSINTYEEEFFNELNKAAEIQANKGDNDSIMVNVAEKSNYSKVADRLLKYKDLGSVSFLSGPLDIQAELTRRLGACADALGKALQSYPDLQSLSTPNSIFLTIPKIDSDPSNKWLENNMLSNFLQYLCKKSSGVNDVKSLIMNLFRDYRGELKDSSAGEYDADVEQYKENLVRSTLEVHDSGTAKLAQKERDELKKGKKDVVDLSINYDELDKSYNKVREEFLNYIAPIQEYVKMCRDLESKGVIKKAEGDVYEFNRGKLDDLNDDPEKMVNEFESLRKASKSSYDQYMSYLKNNKDPNRSAAYTEKNIQNLKEGTVLKEYTDKYQFVESPIKYDEAAMVDLKDELIGLADDVSTLENKGYYPEELFLVNFTISSDEALTDDLKKQIDEIFSNKVSGEDIESYAKNSVVEILDSLIDQIYTDVKNIERAIETGKLTEEQVSLADADQQFTGIVENYNLYKITNMDYLYYILELIKERVNDYNTTLYTLSENLKEEEDLKEKEQHSSDEDEEDSENEYEEDSENENKINENVDFSKNSQMKIYSSKQEDEDFSDQKGDKFNFKTINVKEEKNEPEDNEDGW